MSKCLTSSYTPYQAQMGTYDPFAAGTGGREQRAQIFSSMDAMRPGQDADTQASIDAIHAASSNPGFAAAADHANREIAGDYLRNSPEVENQVAQMRAASGRQAGDANANVRDQFSRAGMGFSTAQQQASAGNTTAATASANQAEAATRLQNYQAERQNQDNAVNTLKTAVGSPIDYLSMAPAARYAPLTAQAGIVNQLASSQTMAQPQDIVEKKGIGDQAAAAVGTM